MTREETWNVWLASRLAVLATLATHLMWEF